MGGQGQGQDFVCRCDSLVHATHHMSQRPESPQFYLMSAQVSHWFSEKYSSGCLQNGSGGLESQPVFFVKYVL